MAEYTVAGGPEFEVERRPVKPRDPDDQEHRRRAELFLRLPSLFTSEQPLEEVLVTIARTIVEHTAAVSAGVNLIRPDDVSTVAIGAYNLPEGYLEGMQLARQTSEQGDILRDRGLHDRSWVLRQAPAYMRSRPEYEHMAEIIGRLPFDTLIGTPFLNRPDLMGFVYMYYASEADVSDDEVAFAKDLAQHARPLMENAWLFREAKRRTAELEALAKADEAIHRSLVLEDVCQALIDLAVDLLGADESLFLTFDAADHLQIAAARGVSEDERAGLQATYDLVRRRHFEDRTVEPLVFEDVANDRQMNPRVKAATNAASAVDVSVFVGGAFFGSFVLAYRERRKFSEDDRRLFRTLATRAGLAIQNALLFRETQQRTTELEALSSADRAMHGSLELEDVYKAMIDLAVNLFGADRSLFLSFDAQDRFHCFAARGVPEEQLAQLQEVYHGIPRANFANRSAEPSVLEDVVNEPGMNPGVRKITPSKSVVDIPVFARGEFFGIFVLGYTQRRTFSAEDRALFRTLSGRATLAIQNALLYSESERRAAELEALSKVDQALHESLVIEDVYQALIDLALELFGADRSLFTALDEQDRPHCFVARGLGEAELAQLQDVYHRLSMAEFASRWSQLTIVEDRPTDPIVDSEIQKIVPLTSSVDIPVFVHGRFFGVFALGYHQRRAFSAGDRRMFGTLASRAGLAIQNALLYRESERRTKELEALAKVDHALHESLVLEDVYGAMIDLAGDLFGADHCLFLTFDEAGVLHAAATRNVPPEHLAGLQPIYAATPRSFFQERRGEFEIVEDVADNPELPAGKEFTNSRSTVDVNVFVGGEFYGMFVLGYHTRRTFDDNDRRLFSTLSARASLAIQNALLFRETQKRTTELEALRRADEALHTSLLLRDVEQAMVDLAAELLGASSSLVVTWDSDGRLEVQATTGIRSEQRERINARYQQLTRDSFAHWVRPFRASLIESVRDHPKIETGLKDDSPVSLAEIPVVVDEELWGFFSIGWPERRTFTPADQQMLDAFAARASLAIQNALLHGETQRRTTELEALYRADEALHRSLLTADVIDAMVDLAVELLGADRSAVVTWQEDETLRLVASRGMSPRAQQLINTSYARFGRAHFEQFSAPYGMGLVENTHTSPATTPELKGNQPGSYAEIPVVVDDKIWGLFTVGWNGTRKFSDSDRKLFGAFASRASLAIQNAVLFEKAQHSASMDERSRIARELHDSVSQALYGIGLGARTARRRLGDGASADVLEPVDYIVQLAESGLAETRALIFELVPDSLEKQGLVLALQRQAAATQARFRVQVAAYLCDEPEMAIRAKEALYRIAQESLHNMAKHAQATQATLTLEPHEGGIRMVVEDNGRGFNPTGEFPGHLGLRSMAERTERIGGGFAIRSSPGAGTTVTVVIPG